MKTTDRTKVLNVIAYLEERRRAESNRLASATDPIERTDARDEEYRLAKLLGELEEILES